MGAKGVSFDKYSQEMRNKLYSASAPVLNLMGHMETDYKAVAPIESNNSRSRQPLLRQVQH